jgi:outer membrane protein OmpA-like peptidoglycan-associated protein
MNPRKTVCSVALPVFALGACAVMPQYDSDVENARAAVLAVQRDPQVVALAPVELSQAVEAMRRTDALWQDRGAPETVHHLAYLAWARAGIASEAARLKAAEASIATANAERDRIQVEARTRDAERARRNAELARQNAQLAQAQADASRRDALQAQQQAAGAQQQAQTAQQQAEAARQQAETAQARAQSLESMLHELQARPTDRGMVVTLGDVLFDSGRAELRSGGMRVVDRLADFMREYPQRRVSIEGFTDSVGNEGSNQELSERRAGAVRRALVERGIDPARVIARGYGEEYPVASNDNATGRQINRRVEIVISDERGMIGSRQGAPVATTGRGQRG